MYGKAIDINENNAERITEAADFLQFSVLMRAISRYLSRSIDINNCITINELSERFDFDNYELASTASELYLSTRVNDFFKVNLLSILESGCELRLLPKEAFCAYLRRLHLYRLGNKKTEFEIFY